MTERNDNKRYRVDWSNPAHPAIVYQLYADDENGKSITACREEIMDHFQQIVRDARREIRKARYTDRLLIQDGKYRNA